MSSTAKKAAKKSKPLPTLAKSRTGIRGFDDITGGGLPSGRPSLICGGPGAGKTLFSMEFLVRGALEEGEPGVFVSFEESPRDLTANVASLGFDLAELVRTKKLLIDHVVVNRADIEETGEFDLDGLFIRLEHAINSIGAKRVVLDTVESLLSGLTNTLAVRSELRRLFHWLKERGVTTVITAERGEKTLTREGLEEYVSDCVIVLDQRTEHQVATRRLQIVKYRGSSYAGNEFPFLIDTHGFSIIPITGSRLDHKAPAAHISSGVAGLDAMLGGKGFYRMSAILVSGTAGTGKTTLAAHFADAACRRGEKVLYFSFEQSPATLMRDLRSVGLDLEHWVEKGLLRFDSRRITTVGMEQHVAEMTLAVKEYNPTVAVVDPISAIEGVASAGQAKNMVTFLSDMLRAQGVTVMMTYLTTQGHTAEGTEAGISSSVDAWVLLRDIETGGERDRAMYVLKARGLRNSNQIREFLLTDHGIRLEVPYIGPAGVLTGAARAALESRERAEAALRRDDIKRLRADLTRKRDVLSHQVAAMKASFAGEARAIERSIAEAELAQETQQADRAAMADLRGGARGRNDRKGGSA